MPPAFIQIVALQAALCRFPYAVARLTEALTGGAVALLDGWYPRVDATREMADGSWRAAQADRHPDPIAECIRWRIAEGELLQAIGRGRGIRRSNTNPLDVLLLTDPPLPVAVHELLSATSLAPTIADLMLAAAGVVFASPTDAARAYPTLWRTPDAAKKAFRREVGDISLVETLNRAMSPTSALRLIRYQRAGRCPPALALIDTSLVRDPHAWLTGRLGELASFDLQDTGTGLEKRRSATASGSQPAPKPPPIIARGVLIVPLRPNVTATVTTGPQMPPPTDPTSPLDPRSMVALGNIRLLVLSLRASAVAWMATEESWPAAMRRPP